MVQAKKKAATKTAAKKCSKKCASKNCAKKSGIHYEKYDRNAKSNMFFVISMTALAATLLFANLIMLNI